MKPKLPESEAEFEVIEMTLEEWQEMMLRWAEVKRRWKEIWEHMDETR